MRNSLRIFFFLSSIVIFVHQKSLAAIENENIDNDVIVEKSSYDDDLEIEKPISDTFKLSYKERRHPNAWILGFDVERVLLNNYFSLIDNEYYLNTFGDEVVLLPTIRFGYKRNISLGAIQLEGAVGYFNLADNLSGTYRKIELIKQSLGITYVEDNILNEPYVAPYATANVYSMGITEKIESKKLNASWATGYGIQFIFGLLIQLNSFEEKSSKTALRNYGLENTYLNIFVSKYQMTNDPEDPDTSTDYNWGLGIKLEF